MKIIQFTGDYSWRQENANESKLDLYIEYHFNFYSKTADYTLCKINNDSVKDFAIAHSQKVSETFNVPVYNRNSTNYIWLSSADKSTNQLLVPCVLIEPLFLSNPTHVQYLINGGVEKLANILVETLNEFYNEESIIGFSVGHKYQRSNPMERGSIAYGHPELTEADLADTILTIAKYKLENQ